MDLIQSKQRNQLYLILLLISGIVLGFLAISPVGTLTFTYDSTDYVNASESLGQYFNGRNQDGYPYLVRAPLLPLYLGAFNNKVLAAWWLNTISFVISLVLIYRIGRALNFVFPMLVALIVATAFSYQWMLNHFFLWTEPFFGALILLLVYTLIERKSFVWISLLCFFLVFTRYAGIIIIVGVVVFFLLTKNYKKSLLLFAIILFCVLVWEFVTISYSQKSTVVTQISTLMSFSHIHYADAFSAWWFPRLIPLWIRAILTVSIIILIVVFLRKEISIFLKSPENTLLVILSGVYVVSIFVLFGSADYSDAERFLSVILPVFMVAVFSFSNQLILNFPKKQWIIMAGIAAWMLYPIARTISNLITL